MASALLLSAGASDYDGKFTFFQVFNEPVVSYTTNSIQVPFQSKQLKFGDLAYATLPKSDDIIKSVTLKSTLGSLYPVSANGYVYPHKITNADYYDFNGILRLRANNVYGFYNTQLLNDWAQPVSAGLAVPSVVSGKFSFAAVSGAMFYTEQAAAFWGFDIRYAVSSNPWIFISSVPQMSLIQSGWVVGFKPPPQNFTYIDSVGYYLPRVSSLLIGGQTIQSINSQTLYTETDLQLPLENQAGLTILVGKNDAASQTVSRNYWTRLTFDQIPISQISNQDVQVAVQFENFNNLTSRTTGGGILNGSAYTQYPLVLESQYVPQIFTYNGLFLTFGGTYFEQFFTLFNESTGELIQKLVIASLATAPVIAFDKVYYIYNQSYLVHYDITPTGLINPFTDTRYIRYGGGTVNKIVPVGQYLFILYDDILVVYDTIADTYSHSAVTIQDFFTDPINNTRSDIAITTGKNIYYPVVTRANDFSYFNQYIFYINIDDFIAGSNTAYHSISVPGVQTITFPGEGAASDGVYIYYPNKLDGMGQKIMYRLNTKTNTIEVYPAFQESAENPASPHFFDGTYVYYYGTATGYSTYRFYNTTMNFSDPNAWTFLRVYDDGSTISSNGTTYKAYTPVNNAFPVFKLVLGSEYIYNFVNNQGLNPTYIVKIDPYDITPSLSASLIVEYAKLINPKPSSTSLIRQTQMNTFTLLAGQTQSQFTMTFSGPVKEFWFKTNASIARILIQLNGAILADEDYNSLNILRPFEKHVITPYQTTGIYSIAIDPNRNVPTGSFNISRIRMATLQIYLTQPYSTDQTLYVFAREFNVLKCDGGLGGLLFN
jgi:Large eukaryotic DNA virus major capsid protein